MKQSNAMTYPPRSSISLDRIAPRSESSPRPTRLRHLALIAPLALAACDGETEPLDDTSFRHGHGGGHGGGPGCNPDVPLPGPDGWGPGDERGNGNTMGAATLKRCAELMGHRHARLYETSHEHSPTMPQALFGDAPVELEWLPTIGLPFVAQVANGEIYSGGLGSQGTQFDALGHFGVLPSPWNPYVDATVPSVGATYYNGFTQAQVKPAANGPMAHLGVEHAPPILTSAVVLDMKELLGRSMEAGELIDAEMIDEALDAAGLHQRGIQPGDAVYLRTGWGERWVDPEPTPDYYLAGPGLSYDAAVRLAEDVPVLVGLDNPFTDAFVPCELTGECAPPDPSVPGSPLPVHQANLVEFGIHQIQNLDLTAAADDDVALGCAMVLPLRMRGAAGSPVRTVLIGRPR
jgi:kynurenine formamidase